jgi:hypothetical protein
MNSTIIRPQAQLNYINRKHNNLVCKLITSDFKPITSTICISCSQHWPHPKQQQKRGWMSPVLSIWLCKQYFLHPRLVIYFFPTPPIKLTLRLQTGARLIIATHLDQSNYLANRSRLCCAASASCGKMPHTSNDRQVLMAGVYNKGLP